MTLNVGVAVVDITPPVGVELCGYGPYLNRHSTGVLDPLYAKAVYVDDGANRWCYVTCDLVGVTPDDLRMVRALCQERLGLKPDEVMVTASHTHSGPACLGLLGWGEPDLLYLGHLPFAWFEAIAQAAAAARPARMRFGAVPFDTFGYDRHDKNGPVDKTIRVLMFDDAATEKTMAVLVNHSVHGVTFGPANTLISADWPGAMCEAIESRLDGAVAVFMQGSHGTINTTVVGASLNAGREAIKTYGQQAADAVMALSDRAQVVETAMVDAKLKKISLPLEIVPVEKLTAMRDEQREILDAADPDMPERDRSYARLKYGAYQKLIDAHILGVDDHCRTEMQRFRIGPVSIVSVPGELFMALGQEILDMAGPGQMVMVAGLANDMLGYIPDAKAWGDPNYSYPAVTVPMILGNFPFRSGVGEQVVRIAGELLGT